MAFDDVKKSLKWAQEGGRVFAYFTAHFATSWDDTDTPTHDSVRYATGYLQASGDALSGLLETVFANTAKSTLVGGVDEGMELRPDLSYQIQVHVNGKIDLGTYLNGQSIGGMPWAQLVGSQVGPYLIRATDTSTAYAISLDRQAKIN